MRAPLPNQAPRSGAAVVKTRDSGVPWLGQVPVHWRVVRVGLVGSVVMGRQRAPQYEKGDHLRPYLRVANVLDGVIDFSDVLEMNFEPEEQRLFGLQPGDILLNEGQSRELVGRSAVYRGEPGAYCFQNTLIRFRVHADLDPEFAQTQFASWLPLGAFQIFSRQSTNIAHLGADRLAQMHMAVPPLDEQRAIVRNIKGETKRIDAIIEAKKRLVDLLAEKRKAIIATAVTRGLDPKIKLSDCGVPWLGKIPAHWKTERARWLFRERDVRSGTGDEEMLTVSHLTGVTPRSEKDVNMFEAETNEGYKLCEPGDLVINTLWAWMGAMGIAPVKGIVSPAYNVYEPGRRLVPAYIDALVRLPVFAQEVTRYSKGVWSSRLRLYPEGFFEIYLPEPPLDEQDAIVAHIARETARLDAVRAATERTIALLKERRAALITAAVTGQLDAGHSR